jgi:signal transduction histidine kinase
MIISAVLLLTILYNLVLIGIILRQTRPRQSGRSYIWFLASISAWILGEAIIDYPGVNLTTVLWAAKGMHIAAGVVAISWAWFCSELTGGTRRIRLLIIALALLGTPWLFLAWGDQLIAGATAQPWGDHLVVGSLASVYTLWLLSGALLGFVLLVRAVRRVRGHLRMQIRYIMWGAAAIWVFAVTTCLVIPLLTNDMGYSKLGPLSSLVTTSATTYAIVRYRLMDIRIVLRTSLTYLLTALLLGSVILALFAMAGSFATDSPAGANRSPLLALLLLVVMIAQPVWSTVRATIDRMIFPAELNFERIIDRAGSIFVSSLESDRIIAALEDAVSQALHPVGMVIYLFPSAGSVNEKRFFHGEPLFQPEQWPHLSALTAYVLTHDDVLLSDEMIRRSVEDAVLGSHLLAHGIAATCPMIAHGHLCGLLLLGEKQSGDIYTEKDLLLLHSLCKHAALAFENAGLYEATREMNQALEQRVLERTEELNIANAQLHSANATLVEMDRSKDRFLAYLSHELLTPLTSILGWTEVALDSQQQSIMLKSLEVIRRSALRQKAMVSELLEISRIVHHKLVLDDLRALDFRELLSHACDSFQHPFAQKQLHVTVHMPDTPCTVMADERRLQQVIDNLLSNALKFTLAGDSIFITLTRDASSLELEVRDTGRGVPQNMLPYIFQPFIQSERDERFGGLGLGLALVRGIIELHGGQVRADSSGIGGGLTATITLPLHTAHYCYPEAHSASA